MCGDQQRVTQVTGPALQGEGPHWDVDTQTLIFVHIEGELVNRYEPSDTCETLYGAWHLKLTTVTCHNMT
jgi:sugar lactone lactonase YvrE